MHVCFAHTSVGRLGNPWLALCNGRLTTISGKVVRSKWKVRLVRYILRYNSDTFVVVVSQTHIRSHLVSNVKAHERAYSREP